MITLVLLTFVDLFVFVFNSLILARVVLSYIAAPGGRFYQTICALTEPILAPVRRLVPPTSGFDLSPLATFFLLQGVQWLLHSLVGA